MIKWFVTGGTRQRRESFSTAVQNELHRSVGEPAAVYQADVYGLSKGQQRSVLAMNAIITLAVTYSEVHINIGSQQHMKEQQARLSLERRAKQAGIHLISLKDDDMMLDFLGAIPQTAASTRPDSGALEVAGDLPAERWTLDQLLDNGDG